MKSTKLSLLLLISLLITVQCCKNKDEEPTPTEPFDESGMLANLSDNLISPSYAKLDEDVQGMETAILSFTNNVSTGNLANARAAWANALLTWQKVAVFQLGPASNIALRENLNIYPVDTVLINSNITSGNYDLASVANYDAKGFQSIDYLINGIASTDDGIVAMYTSDSLASNRIAYLENITTDITSKVSQVNTDWGTYASTFKSSTGTDVGSTIGLLTNELNLYYERYVRNGKVGIPCGANTFTQTPLPEKSEAFYYNQNSRDLLLESMNTMKKLYLGESLDGANGLGYDDYLNHLDAQSTNGTLDNAIQSQITTIETRAAALDPSLAKEATNNQEEMLGLFNDMQLLNSLLKVEMTNSLEVQITYSDTDGD